MALPVGLRRRLPVMLLALFLSVSGGVLIAGPAEAHRDGCHRWHSCPSDTGSYICGDLGYTSECPTSSDPVPAPAPPIEYDFDPPSAPLVGDALVAVGGRVSMTVTAERGSRIDALNATGAVVAHTTGTGKAQVLLFTAPNGLQSYTVTATDAAGNVSEVSDTGPIEVDTIPPTISAFSITAPTPAIGAANLSFTTGDTATYDVAVAKTKVHLTGSTSGPTKLPLWLPNGTYRVTMSLKDEAGNIARAARTVKVAVASPLLEVVKTTSVATSPVLFTVTGPDRSTGTLTVPDGTTESFSIDTTGQAIVSLPLADGAYAGITVALTDFAGRKNALTTPDFTVDTTAPSLMATVDQARISQGHLSLIVKTETGTHVQSTVSPGDTALLGGFIATDSPTRLDHQIAAGTYYVRLVATDDAGNVTIRTEKVAVVVPLSAAQWAVGLGILLVGALALAAAIAWLWRNRARNRARISAWQAARKVAATRKAAERAANAAAAAYQRALLKHHVAQTAYESALAQWQRRGDQLVSFLRLAESETGAVIPNFAEAKLQRDERVFLSTRGHMLEERMRQGLPDTVDTGPGTVVVTDRRVVFQGSKKREWAFDKLQNATYGTDRATLRVTNRRSSSGIRFSNDGERASLLLQLAIADHQGARGDIVNRVRDQVKKHNAGRPTPPTPPRAPEPPTPPRSTIQDTPRVSRAPA